MTKVNPRANHYGIDISTDIRLPRPAFSRITPCWSNLNGAGAVAVRSNDAHTLYSLALAASLLEKHPEADAKVVLPAIMLHDIGWSQIDPGEVLSAIAPGAGRTDLVVHHEKEGARLATEILGSLGVYEATTGLVTAIIDGHDTRSNAINTEDEIVKDADKLWRLTPHGLDTIMDWFGLRRDQALELADIPGAWPAFHARGRHRRPRADCPRAGEPVAAAPGLDTKNPA